MYLKRMEIHGFKSFAERVEIDFETGVTVIVGPNGCGKSNLTDAVQWVLGEQSARLLRGYRMEDVIFSGTTRRRSLGMAEVSLTFDNREKAVPLPFEEINITRRVYRSGEGEYFINKRSCRLRDIQELFARCGISRAAFSITAQGKIDEFVTARPEERRVFLEEIAGVGGYRQRKAEALKKLGETEDALVRVQDIILEMERRRAPLEEQVRVAGIYCSIRESVRELEGRLLNGQLASIRDREGILRETARILDAVIARDGKIIELLEGDFNGLQTGLQARRKDLARLEGELQKIQRLIQETTFARVRTGDKISSCQVREAELQARFTVIRRRREETTRELEEISAVNGRLRELQEQAKSELEALEKENRDYEEKRARVSRDLESLNRVIFDILHQKTALLSEIQGARNKKELLARHRESLTRRVETAGERRDELEREISAGEDLQAAYASSLEKIREDLEQAEGVRQALSKEREETGLKIRSLLQKIEGLKERVRLLKEAEKNQEGYQQGVRSILRAIARGTVFGGDDIRLVEELFTVEPAYETAMETALGRASHYFVCSTPETARKAIEFLKKSGSGRASFLPLAAVDRWVSRENTRRFHSFSGIIGRLSEIVSCEPQYNSVAEFLLGRTYLAENLQAASRFAEHNDYRMRVVTLDGDLIQPGGLYTGGRAGSRYPTTRRRKAEIESIDREMLNLQKELEKLEERERELKARIEESEGHIREFRERHRQFEDACREAEQRIAGLKQEWKQIGESAEISLLEGKEQAFQEKDLDRQIELLGRELAGVEEQERELNAKKAKLEEVLAVIEQEGRAAMNRISSAQVQYSSLSQDLKHQLQKRQQVEQLLQLQEREQREVNTRLMELSEEINVLRSQERDLSEKLAALERQGKVIGDALALRKKQVTARARFVQVREKRIQKLRQITAQRGQQLENTALKLKHLLEKKEQMLAYAREQRLELAERWAVPLDHRGELALKERISAGKREMERLGEINFAAPGEYAALQERISSLLEQKKDLDDAKQSLVKIIGEMDRIAADRFTKTFQIVRNNFQDVFQSLCDGGQADLLLTDEANPLETGVDIVVLPRGKKPRHLSLLSGGEKSLTGIAFLFAMLKAQPAPFYFLDEIEAFLDEANLVRFTGFLKEWSASSQLILISHRYQTMQIADHLYGVTMEEPGVSKLVSVQLGDYLPEDERERQIS